MRKAAFHSGMLVGMLTMLAPALFYNVMFGWQLSHEIRSVTALERNVFLSHEAWVNSERQRKAELTATTKMIEEMSGRLGTLTTHLYDTNQLFMLSLNVLDPKALKAWKASRL